MFEMLVGLWGSHKDLVLAGLILILVFDKAGMIQYVLRRRSIVAEKDKELLVAETHKLITSLQAELANIRERHKNDADYHLRELASLRTEVIELQKQIDARDETITELAQGETRLRHTFMNIATAFAAVRKMCRENNLTPPPFDGWRELMGTDSVFNKNLIEVFTEGNSQHG